jgi:hypothetical protein
MGVVQIERERREALRERLCGILRWVHYGAIRTYIHVKTL